MQDSVITDFGAIADGSIVTSNIQLAIDTTSQRGGGRVVVPPGTFITGAIYLKNNIELHLKAGSILKFTGNQEDYTIVDSRWEGVDRKVYASCIYAENAINIAVTGLGTLDGNGEKWWFKKFEPEGPLLYPRPKLISFDNCRHIVLQDFSCVNSPSWTINPIRCYNVSCFNINIKNPTFSPNTDGINPESSKNVRISNCNIDVGDDCIAIKAGTEDTTNRVSCENITIDNCTMVHGHGGIVLGSEMSGDIRNVTISNCIFQDTDRGIRVKSRRGRGGTVEDIRVNNIVMDHVMCPFVLNLYYNCGPRGKEKYVWDKNSYPVTEETPIFRRFYFSNISCRNITASAGFIYGLAEKYVSELLFQNIEVSMSDEINPDLPAMMKGIEKMSQAGFYVGNSREILFERVTIDNYKGPAFYLENTEDVEISHCKSRNPQDKSKFIEENNI